MPLRHAVGRTRSCWRALAAMGAAGALLSVPLAAVAAPGPDAPSASPSAPSTRATDDPSASPEATPSPTAAATGSSPSASASATSERSPAATQTATPTAGPTVSAARVAAPRVVPPPTATTAVITVKTGGDRRTQESVGPLAGVVLRLYDGGTGPSGAVGEAWATCTSDAAGDCSFVVPGTAAGGANRDRRFWIVQTAAPAGWRINPTLRTGEPDGDSSQATPYAFRTGDRLRAGTVYSSGEDFMRGTGDVLRNASAGIWQSSRVDPVLPNRCGLRVGLVFDLSNSVGETGGLAHLKDASQRFVDSLVGTRSSVAVFTFNSTAPAPGANNANLPATSVSTQKGANTVKARIEGLTTQAHTNWDRGMFQVAASSSTFDLVAVLTDGNPTVYSNDMGPGGYSRIREVEAGIFSANAIKAEGTRLVAFGVGDGIDGLPNNLVAISGPAVNRDYYQTDTYEEAGAVLRSLALGACDSTVTVIKQVVPSTAPAGSVQGAQPAGGWEFTAAGPPITSNPASGTTAATSGSLNFDLTFPGGTGDSPVTFTETQKPGYTLQPVDGANAVCTNVVSGDALPVTDVADGFTVTASRDDAISCTVYNRAPAPVASLVVDKTWDIDGDLFANGEQPPDFRAALTVTGQTDEAFGTELTNYSAGDQPQIDETTDLSARPGCRLVSARLVGADGDVVDEALPYTATLAAGRNV